MAENTSSSVASQRVVVLDELRRLLPRMATAQQALPLGLATIDSHLPDGGLPCGALHEVVPESDGCTASAFGFIAAILACACSPREKIVFITPAHGRRPHGRLHGHGIRALGLDPARLILVETAHRKETLWAMEEAVRSAAPAAVFGVIDKLDLKLSQRLHLAASDARLPLFLLRPPPPFPSPACGGGWGEGSAAATRWRIGTAEAARDRFGLYARPRWHLHLERCRNGRPGHWVVEYDHVAHRFSLAAALADSAVSRGAGAASLPRSLPSSTAHCA